MSSETVSISIAVAHTQNRVIGRNGVMPWKQRADLQRFKEMTWGKPVIMGRKTWESLGRPLPGRTNIVVSRTIGFEVPKGVITKTSLAEAVADARNIAHADGLGEAFVIGGGEVYRQALPLAEYVYVTEIQTQLEGDTFFPELPEEWVPFVERKGPHADEYNSYATRYITYHKK